MILAALSLVALALPDDDGSAAALVEQGPHHRLQGQLVDLVEGESWADAEDAFRSLITSGAPLQQEDWLNGGRAAWALGNITAARDRLMGAQRVDHDDDVAAWLDQINKDYGWVRLFCDDPLDVGLASLEATTNTDGQRSLAFAADRIDGTGRFEGLLPVGTYAFLTEIVDVRPQLGTFLVDLRGLDLDRRTRRQLRRQRARVADVAQPT